MEIETKYASAGFQVTRDQLEDVHNGVVGGEAIELSEEWAQQVGAQQAYYPQQKVVDFLDDAESIVGYDQVPYFAANHKVHPLDPTKGTYSNLLTDAKYQIAPSDDSEDILDSMREVFAYMASLKMPNGRQPRFLRPAGILCGPHIAPIVANAIDAKFIAAGNGTEDKTALVQKLGYALPIQADELSNFDGYYVIAKQMASSKIGALIQMTRRPFEMRTFAPMTMQQLSQKEEYDYQVKGKQSISPGHPHFLFKVRAA